MYNIYKNNIYTIILCNASNIIKTTRQKAWMHNLAVVHYTLCTVLSISTLLVYNNNLNYELVSIKYNSRQDQHTTALGQAQVLSGIAEEQSTGK